MFDLGQHNLGYTAFFCPLKTAANHLLNQKYPE